MFNCTNGSSPGFTSGQITVLERICGIEALVGACLLLVLSVTNFAVRERRTWPSRCLPAYMHHVDTADALQDDRALGPPVRRRRLYRPIRLRRLPTSFFLCSLCLHLVLLSSNLFGDPAHASEMLGAPSAACWAQALAYQFFATGCVRPPAASRPAFRPSAAITPLLPRGCYSLWHMACYVEPIDRRPTCVTLATYAIGTSCSPGCRSGCGCSSRPHCGSSCAATGAFRHACSSVSSTRPPIRAPRSPSCMPRRMFSGGKGLPTSSGSPPLS